MPATSLKVLTILGTRPEIVRLSRVIAALDDACHHVLVHTGQNYDRQLSSVFFDDLQLRTPDHELRTDTSSLGSFLGTTFIEIEKVLDVERPDAVLVLGDTNSALAALVAKRRGIAVFHMEAGNRCFDANVPEETNRRVIDHFADVNLVYTEHARRNLLAEGLHPRSVYLTGSPLAEVLASYRDQAADSDVVSRLGLTTNGYFVLSMHREENVDDPDRLRALLGGVSQLASAANFPVIVSAHPRLSKRMAELGIHPSDPLMMHEPFGYFDYLALQLDAHCVVSDSGTVSEESSMLGFPAVTIRDSIERPEAMETGSIVLAAPTPDALRDSVAVAIATHARRAHSGVDLPDGYSIPNCSERVVNLIVGIAPLHATWSGLRGHETDSRVTSDGSRSMEDT